MHHCPLDTTIQTNYSFTKYHHPQHDAIIIGNWIYISQQVERASNISSTKSYPSQQHT